MNEPYIKLLKRIVDWQYFGDAHVLQLLIYLLSTVNFKAEKWRGITIKAGQKITSIDKLANACECSKNTIQRCLKILVDSDTIEMQSDNKKTIITLCNYAKYQRNNENSISKNDMQTDTQVDMPTDTLTDTQNDIQIDTQLDINIRNKEYKKEKNDNNILGGKTKQMEHLFQNGTNGTELDFGENEKKEKSCVKKEKETKKKYGEFQNVQLTDSEFEKLKKEYAGNAPGIIEYLSAYKAEKNYPTKSDYLTIKRWVADAYGKKNNSQYRPARAIDTSERDNRNLDGIW